MSVPMYTERSERLALSDLVRELFTKISELISTQLELTKTEIKVSSRKMVIAAAFGVGALLVGTVFVALLGVSMILLLDKVVDLAWAAVITTAIYLLVAGIFGFLMMKEIQKNNDSFEV